MRNTHVIPLIAVPLLGAALVMAGDSTHPLANAKAGQWVLLMESEGAGKNPKAEAEKAEAAKERFFYRWIDKVEKSNVSIKTQSVTKDGQLGLAEPLGMVVDLDVPAEKPAAAAAQTEEIPFKDKKLACERLEFVRVDPKLGKVTTTKWISKEVPIYGIVRAVSVDQDGKELSRTELLDFGSSGGSARPMEKKN